MSVLLNIARTGEGGEHEVVDAVHARRAGAQLDNHQS